MRIGNVKTMKSDTKITNIMALPKIEKVIVNIGLGRSLKDEKFLEIALRDLALITGQKPKTTMAKKSIANFKIREGDIIGAVVTLRGQKMRDFIDRLVKIALPRTRDFRGIDAKSIDKNGNLTIGVKEHIVFPEIKGEEVRNIFGFEVTIVVKAKNKEEALVLYRTLGFPVK